jgi:glycosyltransferase involved in cell wall biosynthesis
MKMLASMLQTLPESPPGKTGWPWDVESLIDDPVLKNTDTLPKITIVTPSYNQGEFLEETIRSVLLQNYPNLEYIIIDGGSTDQSVKIIKKYEPWIDYWVSEPDCGQSHAINKGFERASGQWGNWINSDDLLAKDALLMLAGYVQETEPKTLFIGQCILTDKYRTTERISTSNIQTFEQLIDIKNYWRNGQSVAQQNVLFNLESFQAVGGLNEENHYSMDYELWGDLLLNGNRIQQVDFPVGIFRHYEGQKISDKYKTTKSLVSAAASLVKKKKCFSKSDKLLYLIWLKNYHYKFNYRLFRSKIGIKRRLKKIL